MTPVKTLIMALSSVVVLQGCAVYARPHRGVKVVAPYSPPAPKVVVKPAAPGAGYVWVGGFWKWTGNGYTWKKGHWVHRPAKHRYWVKGHWKKRRGGWIWIPGHWS